MLFPGFALAEDNTETFTGARIGVDVSRVRTSLRGDPGNIGATEKNAWNGVGYRGFVGYDLQLANMFVVGAEAGIGGGGRAVTQTGPAGRYTVDPGLTYDISARAGIVAAPGLLLYGRVGYRWLRTDQKTALANAGTNSNRRTEGSVTYGAGAEVLVSPSFSVRAEYNRTPYSGNLKANALSIGGAFRF
ncbi:outer membrane beta-barrel protein [Novosphingobium sp. Chol11]|uniref:outer membrane protein n=1 Tax=Novosphingobium sp. Chol11 TaxID=1385763 RepID=UPI0025E26443|nr:outer membrane beta-barrel protein [Novosphingobium sp. Chol11]